METTASRHGIRVNTKAVLLLGLSLYFAFNLSSGNINNYINARFAWLSYVAVVLFAALGAAALRGGARSPTRVGTASLMMMAVPLLLGTLIPSRPLGAEAIDGNLRVGAASYGVANVTAINKPPLERDILDWSRLFAGEEAASVFNGQQARVLGFVYKEPGFPDGTFMVGRFTVSCCVADALPLGLPAAYDGTDDLDEGAWVEVEGTFRAGEFMGLQVPVLQVAALTLAAEPSQPYLYP